MYRGALEEQGCLTQRGKLKATKCRRHVAPDIKAVRHGCHYVWRLDQYTRNIWFFSDLLVRLRVSESDLPLRVAVRMKAITPLEYACLTAGSGVKVEEDREIYRATTRAADGIVRHLQLERLTFKLGSGNPKGTAQYIFRLVRGHLTENISMIQH